MFGRATGSIQLQLPFAHGKLVLIIYARVLHKVSSFQLFTNPQLSFNTYIGEGSSCW